jgi:rhamnulokinase
VTGPVFAAVDLGASGGRVVAGRVADRGVELDVVHRFTNGPVPREGHLRWDFERLLDEVLRGLAMLATGHPGVVSIGVDTWGVDYGVLGEDGSLLADPVSYRDGRTTPAVIDAVHGRVGRDELFDITGLQFLPFTTIYQLAAERMSPQWADVAHVVPLPDLLAHRLTGVLATDATIASTTGLVDVRTGGWAHDVLRRLDLDPEVLPPIVAPGTVRGTVLADLRERLGLPADVVVTTVGGHDTASAVAAVPATSDSVAYVSSGTWSLVGVERDRPVLTAEARDANLTNERAVDGRIRLLRNVAGLWLLQECVRTWAAAGDTTTLDGLLAAAAATPDDGIRIDVDAPELVAPGDMPMRISAAAGVELDPPATVRVIVDSLADAYARTVDAVVAVSGADVETVHVVGGGSHNAMLCARTAVAAGRPVVAGPAEATALGNVLVQARAHGAITGSWTQARRHLARSPELRRYEPDGVGVRL